MKSVLVLCTFLGLGPSLYGQLTVKPSANGTDSYLYVNELVLYVAQEVNLQKNADESDTEASIYLRKEAQLIQGEEGTYLNSGNGLLSVFQEGTSNAYDYNYWSSPVGAGVSGNGAFGITMLSRPVSYTKSEKAISTAALDGFANPLSISNRWIYTYSGTSYSNWYAVFGEPVIPSGYGFSMKGVNGTDPTLVDGRENNQGNGQRYDFRGRPNNAPVKIAVQKDKTSLIGNPFPSALDLSRFLMENSGTGSMPLGCGGSIDRENIITGIAYFWDSVENGSSHYLQDYIGGYGAFSPVDPCTAGLYERPLMKSYGGDQEVPPQLGKHYERRFLPIGQGFMVQGTSDSELVFNNNQRIFKKEGEHSDFKRKMDPKEGQELLSIPKLRLQVEFNNTYTRSLSLAFWPTATPENDFGMDAEAFDLAPSDIGWNHNGRHYIIDVRPFDETEEVPFIVNINEPQALLKISVPEMEGLTLKEMYLVDKESDTYYPIAEGTFQVSLEKGEYPDRFYLSFLPKETPPISELPKKTLGVHLNKDLRQIEISNPEGIAIRKVEVYDLTGRKVFSTSVANEYFYNISIENYANSVYIVHIITAGSEKLIVKVPVKNTE